ncbi:hypothetical protein WJ0W_004567 [Paenibacillus melissococcoides]|uniref:DUF2281 domain-containing protein n=1 Tax=Paenibacillus melissococcoides TaxID=2912268 RepID=A0ABM9G656_9BACL|nr:MULTISPECIES: hypothetical protein [Paenibacillus]MEB9895083.1 hypothetical protein [Bacillus cereus]CAH8247333.1 hypothetical protein WJ0W_004567 [Paenibacillus melissococcoides]CAH8717399.1 hypothetical protein HTL2_004934 [Paenibacillus melissococcoides]CAH8718386.1 hypothetical protein WDD9_005206 [Paenibacillus melissococcoides]GIO77867.1 hypothetical protein J6TS7_14770 [Paenibacillus dendritiformis]
MPSKNTILSEAINLLKKIPEREVETVLAFISGMDVGKQVAATSQQKGA